MELIDSHAHLDFPQFDADRAEVLNRVIAWGELGLDYHYDHSPFRR